MYHSESEKAIYTYIEKKLIYKLVVSYDNNKMQAVLPELCFGGSRIYHIG